ncbi:VOC family protein [Paenibacillus glycinis]|uniref:VOC family protein n=1 Tax=Paenibacillus glycinis TaxID=2697035 RepID=A0ABW9XXL9_9BACL|nr:VOC family protein [Paenibacillus glycinis]NBD27467.1 VOC family protein [Paenibacillus glycinis]
MKPRITVLTLGVDDLDKSLAFYRDGLGLPTEGIIGTEFEHGAVAFFDLQAGMKLAIWKRADLSHEAKVPLSPRSSTEMTIGHNVGSKAEVDRIMALAEKAGAVIADRAHDAFWGGYSGHFMDPDGHLWEIVWNPAWELDEEQE